MYSFSVDAEETVKIYCVAIIFVCCHDFKRVFSLIIPDPATLKQNIDFYENSWWNEPMPPKKRTTLNSMLTSSSFWEPVVRARDKMKNKAVKSVENNNSSVESALDHAKGRHDRALSESSTPETTSESKVCIALLFY